MRVLHRRPSVLVSASAIGYYGDRGDEALDETSPRGEGPSTLLRAAMGELSHVLLDSQRVAPTVAQRTGYPFKYATLKSALEFTQSGDRPLHVSL